MSLLSYIAYLYASQTAKDDRRTNAHRLLDTVDPTRPRQPKLEDLQKYSVTTHD